MKLKKIVEDIKYEFKRRPIITVAMFLSLVIGVMSFIKPGYTQNIWTYIGITAFNTFLLGTGVFLLYWFVIRRKLK